MKNYLALLIIREMQIGTTAREHLMPVRIDLIRKINNSSVDNKAKTEELLCSLLMRLPNQRRALKYLKIRLWCSSHRFSQAAYILP